MDGQSGSKKTGKWCRQRDGAHPFGNAKGSDYEKWNEIDEPDGGASRYFKQFGGGDGSVNIDDIRNKVLQGDVLKVLPSLPDDCIDAVVTDPPYGLEFMGNKWDAPWRANWQAGGFSKPGIGERERPWPSFSATRRFGSANPTCAKCGGRARGAKKCTCEKPEWKPIGKRRNAENEGLPDDMTGADMTTHMQVFQQWCEAWAKEMLRVMKPGGHAVVFGGTRMYHRMACALEDAGFEIRDQLQWLYLTGFPKSLNVSQSLDKMARGCPQGTADPQKRGRGELPERVALARGGATGKAVTGLTNGYSKFVPQTEEAKKWEGWGTALKPAFEPIVLVRKPLLTTVVANVVRFGTGALNIEGCKVEDEKGVRRWPANVAHDGSEEVAAVLGDGMRCFYCPKASKKERNEGLDEKNLHPCVKPVALMRWLCRLVTPPGGLVLDPFFGSGSTGIACVEEGFSFVGVEKDVDYIKVAESRIEHAMKGARDDS